MPSSPATATRPFSRRAMWYTALGLSPLAYLASFFLAKTLPNPVGPISINRERAIEIALKFADSRHIDTRGWSISVGAQKNDEASDVLAHMRPAALEQLKGASTVTVRLRSHQSADWLRVLLTPTGRMIGFNISDPGGTPAKITDEAAGQIATSFLRDFLGGPAQFDLSLPKVRFVNEAKQDRMVEWSTQIPEFSGGRATFHVEMVGDRVITEGNEVIFKSSFLRTVRPGNPIYYGFFSAGVLYIAFMGIFAIVRYVRRASDKEVSHRRTVLVMVLLGVFSIFKVYYGAAQVTVSVNGAPPTTTQAAIMMGIFFIMFSLIGGFFGMAYGAGEGDARAAYPGKLTSLDALLSGKLFSVNVARSILAGGAFAGVVLLIQCIILVLVRSPLMVADNDIVATMITDLPLGQAFSGTAMHAVGVAGFGLLVPIAFLRPRLRKEWLLYALLPLCTMLSRFVSADHSNWRNFTVTVIGSMAITCIPFFYGDLLAAVSGVVALDLVSNIIYRSAASGYWARMSLDIVCVGVVFLAVEIWYAEHGKIYEDWEVRPLYARHLAERLSLQAEIGAARQAQLRLLPDVPPHIAGLSIAGSCVPAREVGGDFYDFYALDDHRLAVFIAEGGHRELASAMPIALAKGFLLYTSRLDLNPVEVLRRVRDLLGGTLSGAGVGLSMLYAVIDGRAGTIRYARTGDSPSLAINGNRAVEEIAASRGGEVPIHHGAATLAPQDSLVFYTDGLAAQIAERKREPVGRFLAKTAANLREGSAAELHSAIFHAAIRRRTEPPVDDVTAVVIRLEKPSEQALEVVV